MSDELATKADLTEAIQQAETRLLERLEKVETTLLKEFHMGTDNRDAHPGQ
jgi:hypothetical protein